MIVLISFFNTVIFRHGYRTGFGRRQLEFIFQNLAISINWREKQEFVVKVGENQSFQTSTIFGQLNL